ncbi:MAG: hypothetical protein IPJ06_17415 [Saprospiraceae bacterium]|nr:hypothetical protein [Saprospiraceae bacterium]
MALLTAFLSVISGISTLLLSIPRYEIGVCILTLGGGLVRWQPEAAVMVLE